MTILDGSIEIDAPARFVYEQWSKFENFPGFAAMVERIDPIDSRRSVWRVNLGGRHEEWEAEITEMIPGKRIAWRSRTGSINSGVVNFHETAEAACAVTLHLQYDPHGIIEILGDELGVVQRLVERFLDQFKEFVEIVA